jgi:hypothetical protein
MANNSNLRFCREDVTRGKWGEGFSFITKQILAIITHGNKLGKDMNWGQQTLKSKKKVRDPDEIAALASRSS